MDSWINDIHLAIEKNNLYKIITCLDKINLSDATTNSKWKFICNFLFSLIAQNSSNDVIIHLIDKINNERHHLQLLNAPLSLCLVIDDIKILEKIFNAFDDITSEQYMLQLLNCPVMEEEMIISIFDKYKQFTNIKKEDYNYIINIVEKNELDQLENIDEIVNLHSKFKEHIMIYRKNIYHIPEWIKTDKIEDKIKLVNFSLPKVELVFDKMMSQLSKGYNIYDQQEKVLDLTENEELFAKFKRFYNPLSVFDKIEYLQNIKLIDENFSFDDKLIFNKYGPVNGYDNCQKCKKYGGCRMLYCANVEIDASDLANLENEDTIIDWFHYQCDNCSCHIPNRKYAIRIPCEDVGWRNCYCSYDCATYACNDNELEMLNTIHEQLLHFGIF